MTIRERLNDELDALSCWVETAMVFIHQQGFHVLYLRPDGSLYWRKADTPADTDAGGNIKLYAAGSGVTPCACDCCARHLDPTEWGFDMEQDVYIADIIDEILRDRIPVGWFDDEK